MTIKPIKTGRRPGKSTLHAGWVPWLLAAAACVPACASGPASAPVVDAGATSLAQIERAIGAARCTADDQCRVAQIGSRGCGGPETHRAWSTLTTSAPALEALLQTHALERQRWRDKVGLLSTCEALPAPGAVCNRQGDGAGRCVLVPAGSGQR